MVAKCGKSELETWDTSTWKKEKRPDEAWSPVVKRVVLEGPSTYYLSNGRVLRLSRQESAGVLTCKKKNTIAKPFKEVDLNVDPQDHCTTTIILNLSRYRRGMKRKHGFSTTADPETAVSVHTIYHKELPLQLVEFKLFEICDGVVVAAHRWDHDEKCLFYWHADTLPEKQLWDIAVQEATTERGCSAVDCAVRAEQQYEEFKQRRDGTDE